MSDPSEGSIAIGVKLAITTLKLFNLVRCGRDCIYLFHEAVNGMPLAVDEA
jgi:hypothetical protein